MSGVASSPAPEYRNSPTAFVVIGLLAGFASGFFGVGGGVIIVPLLLLLARFPQKLASGTSLAAIAPAAVAGLTGYAVAGTVDWIAGTIIAVGSIVGAQIGAWLLAKLPVAWIRWIFIVVLLTVVVQLFFTIPVRGVGIEFSPGAIVGLVLLGLVTGSLASLVGVGGGIVVVPVLLVVFGTSDLVAKGTSLLMMLPTSISGTVGNARRGNVALRPALLIGLCAAVASFGGTAVAVITPPQLATILFAGFVSVLIVRMVLDALKKQREERRRREADGAVEGSGEGA